MAITFVNGTGADSGGALSVTVAAPAGILANDVLIAGVCYDSSMGLTPITPDQSWMLFASWNLGNAAVSWYWRTATASEPANYKFSIGASRMISAGVAAFRGCPVPDDPIDVIGMAVPSLLAPSITTVIDKDLILLGGGSFTIGTLQVPAWAGTGPAFNIGGSFQTVGIGLFYNPVQQTPPGATGNVQAEYVGGANTFLFSIKGAPVPPKARVGGDLIGLTYDPPEVEDGQDVTAWHRHPLGASAAGEATCLGITTIPAPDATRDELWLLVQRTIDGRSVTYWEYMEKAFETGDAQSSACCMDASVQYSGTPVSTVFPLDHLEGETVRVLADGAAHPDCVVTNGMITLNAPHSVIQVGLKFQYNFVTLRVEAGSQTGTAQAKLKRITKLNGIRLLNSLGGKFGQYGAVLDELEYRDTDDPMNSPPGLFTGDKTNLSYVGDWERNGRIQVSDDGPFPFCIVALFPELNTTDG